MRRIALVLLLLTMVAGTAAFADAQAARGGRGPAAALVAPAKLVALLPTVPGWTKGEPDSEVITTGVTMVVARVSYDKGDLSMSLEITDTLASPMLMMAYTAMTSAASTTGKTIEGVTGKTITVAGFPGVEAWDSKEKVADVIVAVNGRFIVKASLSDAKDTSAPRAAVEAVDLKALAALK
jgi:hypothetical protein